MTPNQWLALVRPGGNGAGERGVAALVPAKVAPSSKERLREPPGIHDQNCKSVRSFSQGSLRTWLKLHFQALLAQA